MANNEDLALGLEELNERRFGAGIGGIEASSKHRRGGLALSLFFQLRSPTWKSWQFGRRDHGLLRYRRMVTTGHPTQVPINIPPPKDLNGADAKGHWCATLVACGTHHTLAIVEWRDQESDRLRPTGIRLDIFMFCCTI
ncbi:hypothetical protein PHJA_000455800 [Phtheirospermum japonicum]|uniref:Uncharacterized protein n=1 Tax=Phtheirospermum japonicum TaxID=374723 RepID=A0A830BEC7_9LAMI|nr:hypothetical protein PHJA_000455800 [Phtheirospermum japonicum]